MKSRFIVVDEKLLPEVLPKVLKVKEILTSKSAKDISEAVKLVGISRSTYYKYKDGVFKLSDGAIIQKATIGVTVGHKRGTLSNVLDIIAECGGNILTIHQDIPINNTANVTITMDISSLKADLYALLETLKVENNILGVSLIAME